MALERRPIGTPVVWGGEIWQWCAIRDTEAPEGAYRFHNFQLVSRALLTGETSWASEPVKAYSEIWTDWEDWLNVDAGGTGIIIEHGDPNDQQGLLGDGESTEAPLGVSVLVGNLFIVDSIFGVVVAWNLASKSEAWRLDPSTQEEIKLFRILGGLSDRVLLQSLQQITQTCTIYELPPLDWDNFPAAWDDATPIPHEVKDLAEGYSFKMTLCSVGINGILRPEEWVWPSEEAACGNESWAESVEISSPADFAERSTGSLLGLQTKGDDNYRLWGRTLAQFPIPNRPKGTFESITEGTLTLKNTAASGGTITATADYAARWWWQQTRRGTLPEDPVYVEGAVEDPDRTFVRHGSTVGNVDLQGRLDDVRESLEAIDALSGLSDLQKEALTSWPDAANRQLDALDTTQFSADPEDPEGDGIGSAEITGTQRLYYLAQVPGDRFPLQKFKGVYWHSRYNAYTWERFIAGPRGAQGTWSGFDVGAWDLLWQFDYADHPERPRQVYATNVPIISGPHLVSLVRALDSTTEEPAPVLLVLNVDTGAIVREVDLEEQPTDEDLRFQMIVSGGHILFRLAGALQKIPLEV